MNTMTVSEAGISLTAPCWADPTLHCLPAILRTEQVKPASHGCSQVVKERLAPGPCRLCSADVVKVSKLSIGVNSKSKKTILWWFCVISDR